MEKQPYGTKGHLEPPGHKGPHCHKGKKSKNIFAWGINVYGALGIGSSESFFIPVQVFNNDLSKVNCIAVGENHSLAIRCDRTVWAWGDNENGQLGIGSTGRNAYIPIEVSNTNLFNAVAIAAGIRHSLAIKYDGTVWAWGNNTFGQLGDGTNTNRNVPVQVDNTNLTNAVEISSSGNFCLAIKYDGTVWAWGQNNYGQLGDGTNTNSNLPVQVDNTNLTNAVAIAAGRNHGLAIKYDGTVWAWGYNNFGQLGDGTNINSNVPVQVDDTNLTNTVAIAAGVNHSLAIRSDGTVWAWGNNSSGQLGDGTNISSNVPVQVDDSNLFKAVAISCADNSLAIRCDGTVWAWGNNDSGVLGDGTTIAKNIPIQVEKEELKKAELIAAGIRVLNSIGHKKYLLMKKNMVIYTYNISLQ